MQPMEIRQLAPGDAPVYRALRLRALREHAEAFSSSHQDDEMLPLSHTEKRLQPGDGCRFWGAFDDARLCGMVGLEREQRSKTRHKARVVGMYVAPAPNDSVNLAPSIITMTTFCAWA